MPHLTLDYSDNTSPPKNISTMFLKMHQVLNSVGGIKIENCKSRIRKATPFLVAEGASREAFLHLDVRFMKGRTYDIKRAIGNNLLEILKQAFADDIQKLNLQITVEIRDIEPDSYFKYPEGTLNY